jgi:hypothetical protein
MRTMSSMLAVLTLVALMPELTIGDEKKIDSAKVVGT